MNEYEYEINGRNYKVIVEDVLDGDSAVLQVNGETYQVSILSQPAQAAPSAAPQAAATASPVAAPPPKAAPKPAAPSAGGGGAVTAPMPGTVLKILVNVGDAVTAGQTVMVIEAMKMENEIKANSTGNVSKILVSSGDNVAAGAPLINIE